MRRLRECLDDAILEDFVSTSNVEPVSRLEFPSRRIGRMAHFEYLEPYYDVRRSRSSLGHRRPTDYEEDR